MRILYLSLSNTQYSANYHPYLASYIDRVASPGTEVEIRGARVGRIDSFRFWELLDTTSILDSVLDAQAQGFDAVAIGNILDPGLREARSMVDIPVLGLGETSMLIACMMGSRFVSSA
jgi:Asp/Glu/hydantoin racemase